MKRLVKERGGGGVGRADTSVGLNRDRAAELTQPVWFGVGGPPAWGEVIDYCGSNYITIIRLLSTLESNKN